MQPLQTPTSRAEPVHNRIPHIAQWASQNDAPPLEANAAYMNARQEWNERYGDYISRERAWRLTAFLALGVAVICASGMAYLGAQNKLVPYIVEVDKLGQMAAVQRADAVAPVDPRIIRAQLANWIENVRTVYQDAGAERHNIQTAYALIRNNDAAYKALNDYYNIHDPFKRAETEGVSVEINSVMPISENTWRVEWIESSHSAKGEVISSLPYQANLTVAIAPPSEEAHLLKNPAGVYITHFNWSQRLN